MRSPRRKRSAFTLIEVITVLSLSTFVLASVAIAITALSRLNRRFQEGIPVTGTVVRLSLQFRSDIHSAREVTSDLDDQSRPHLKITGLNGQQIEYHALDAKVLRVAGRGSEAKHREEFLLSRNMQARWTKDDSGATATLWLEQRLGQIAGSSDDLRTITVDAVVGNDERWPE